MLVRRSSQTLALRRSRPALLALLFIIAIVMTLLALPRTGPTSAAGTNSITSPDTGGTVGLYTSLALDASGNPVVAYYDATNTALKVLHCGNADCTAGNSITSPDTADDVGQYASMALDTLGNPVVSYNRSADPIYDLKVLHCGNANCTSGNSIETPDAGWYINPDGIAAGFNTSLALDGGGAPVVSSMRWYTLGFVKLTVLHCGNADCSAGNSIELPGGGGSGETSLALDSSGFPVVGYTGTSGLEVLHCGDADCTSGNTVNGPGSGAEPSLALDALGYPVVSYVDVSMRLLHCGDADCASGNSISSLGGSAYTSLVLDAAGYPVVSYAKWDGSEYDLEVLHCGNANCTSGNSVTSPDTAGSVGLYTSLVLDASGNPVVSYYDATNGDLKILHCGDANCTPGVPGVDDNMTSRGKFQILVSPDFRDLMDGYPGYDGVSRLDSPDLYDPSTVVGRSVYHLDGDATDTGGAGVGSAGTSVSDSDFSLVPGGFEGPAGSREVHTEIRSMNLTAGPVAVRAGTNAPDQPMSPGEVESQSGSGNPVDDFPADSFFNVFVEVDLPGVFDFPGGTLYNSDPLLVLNNDVTELPPRVVYVHGNSSAVPVFFKSDNLPAWEAGDLFGWLALAGHGASFDDSPEDSAEFEQTYQEEVASDPLPVPDSDAGGAPDDLEIAKSGDLGNPADDAAILALDSDGDGCTSAQELNEDDPDGAGPKEAQDAGGLRDPLNPNDFYDVLGPGAELPTDGVIDLANDILGVIVRFAPLGTEPEYDVRFDRGPKIGPNTWNMGPPDGVIDLANDILGVILQFQHSCV